MYLKDIKEDPLNYNCYVWLILLHGSTIFNQMYKKSLIVTFCQQLIFVIMLMMTHLMKVTKMMIPQNSN